MPRCLFRRCANIEFTGEGGARQADQSQAAVAGWQGLIFWQAGAANGQRLTAGDGQSLTNGSIFVAAVLNSRSRSDGRGLGSRNETGQYLRRAQRVGRCAAPQQKQRQKAAAGDCQPRPSLILRSSHSIGRCSYRCASSSPALAPGHRSTVPEGGFRQASSERLRRLLLPGLADRTPPT